MDVRPEAPADFDAIDTVVRDAFGSEIEPKLVQDLRASDGYLPDLALVADADGGIVGHVMFTITDLEDGTAILMLSPLAVAPAHQRRGVGTALVEEGLRRCRERAEPVVIVEGDPRYYSRFGFRRASELGLEKPSEQTPEWAFQAIALPGHDASVRGRVRYPPPFDGL